ncbi:MAG: 16S rRNA (cytosine(1402)-N(4))-methyltransferase RsmH [Candidatus Magasanikbacteria bacterium]|nr:16S rRNA (cytosine(1402)-N(4))-methyltransferase RsmH [Candidatus Magasanikbacteria bacterium]
MLHIPVLLDNVVEGLNLAPGKYVVDCTLGDAGHAEAILRATAPDGKLLGIDADPVALQRAQEFLHEYRDRVIMVQRSFNHLQEIIAQAGGAPVDVILFDLGWSLPQVKERGRGFSFMADEPLDMRYDPNAGQTAAELINTSTQDELTRILRLYGEEKQAREIARGLIAARPVESTQDVVHAVMEVYHGRHGKIHPATKTFQALRIATNNELEVLEAALPQAVAALSSGGRIAVITFHSLEDRIVKQFFKAEKQIRVITKKPIVAHAEELRQNPAARSAKLRIAEKV